jgi:hypothetical protein
MAIVALGVVLPVLLAGCVDPSAEDKEAILAAYRERERCNNEKDGRAVLEVYAERSFKPYEKVIRAALSASKEELRQLAPTDRVEVLLIRARAKAEDIEKLSAREFVAYATGKGWYTTPPEDRRELTLKRFTFKGDEAWAELYEDRQPSGMRLHFLKEGEKWRLDEPDEQAQVAVLMRRDARESGEKMDDYVLMEVERRLGKEPPGTIWTPLKQ